MGGSIGFTVPMCLSVLFRGGGGGLVLRLYIGHLRGLCLHFDLFIAEEKKQAFVKWCKYVSNITFRFSTRQRS